MSCSLKPGSILTLATKLLLALTVLLLEPRVHGALLLYDGFDYPSGEQLGESTSRTRWSNDKEQFTIARGSLDYAALKSSTGNRVSAAAAPASLDSVRTLDGSWPKQSKGTLYLSFILRLHSAAELDHSGASLLTISDTFNRTELLGIDLKLADQIKLGVIKYASTNTPVSSSAFFDSGPGADMAADGSTTYLIVAKYEWVEGASNDVVTLWVNPTSLGAAEDPAHKVFASTGQDGAVALVG